LNEEALARAAKAGDPAALSELVRRESPRVAGLLVRLLGPRRDLEDLVQVVFLEVCRALPRFRGQSKLSTFVGGITVRVARRALRGSAWQRRRGEWPEVDPAAPGSSQESLIEAKEQLRKIHAMLEDVPPRKRVAFLLWAVEGHSAEEVAELMKCTLFTARKRIYDVRRQLRDRALADPALKGLVAEEKA
jgi:RNA polymerase sigma-70 factor, ECF subfamily